MHVSVVGLGYVGLPLVIEAIKSGHQVIGIDTNEQVVENLNLGLSHVEDIKNQEISDAINQNFRATSDYKDVARSDVIVICVPTPLGKDGGPDLTFVEKAGTQIGGHLKRGVLISLESTSYPGTTEEVLKPILDHESGLTAGKDYSLIFSPERIDPGNKSFGFRNTPKIVGGLDEKSLNDGINFYSTIVDQVIPAKGLKEAEMAKLLENTYRHINIALVNEMAKFCHELNIDIWDVIKNASTKPFGFQAFYPGPGVGGHCIPIDPNYLSHKVQLELGYPFKFVKLAEEINKSMPDYVVKRIRQIFTQKGLDLSETTVLLLGVSYKKDIADIRESPALPVAKLLQTLGVNVEYWDPYVSSWKVNGNILSSVKNLVKSVNGADLVVLLQDHSELEYENLLEYSDKIFSVRGNSKVLSKYKL